MTWELDTEARFPSIPWRKAIRITGLNDIGIAITRFGCRLCISKYGIKARDIPGLYVSVEEHAKHMEEFHGLKGSE